MLILILDSIPISQLCEMKTAFDYFYPFFLLPTIATDSQGTSSFVVDTATGLFQIFTI